MRAPVSKYFRIETRISAISWPRTDPIRVAYIAKNTPRIRVLHFTDRKKNQGENYPWGTGGDTADQREFFSS